MVTIVSSLLAALVALGGVLLRMSVARHEPVRSAAFGLFSVELRRRALVLQHPSALGGPPLLQPCERRIRVFRLAGVALWRQGRSVDLPPQAAGMIGTLTARDFDAEFDSRFRLASFARLLPAWLTRTAAGPAAKNPAGQPTKRLGNLSHK